MKEGYMVNINELLKCAKQKLNENNIDMSEARILLAFVLNVDVSTLVTINECENSIAQKYLEVISKRIARVPYSYIVGKQEFMKLPFVVSPDVLIPNSDTEILVENVIKIANNMKSEKIDILDMCTGSGCIAISLKKYIKNCNVLGTDISEKALEIAKENAILNNTEVTFVKSDLFSNIQNYKYDILVSNPPYIKRGDIENLQAEVKYEPILALDGGIDGLDMYRKIIETAKQYLKENGNICLEIGYNQANDVTKILQDNSYTHIQVIKDLSNNDRVVIAKV